jgi:hypothetical protein
MQLAVIPQTGDWIKILALDLQFTSFRPATNLRAAGLYLKKELRILGSITNQHHALSGSWSPSLSLDILVQTSLSFDSNTNSKLQVQ